MSDVLTLNGNVLVNSGNALTISGGGGNSSYQLIAQGEFSANVTSTGTVTLTDTIQANQSIYTSEQIVYVKIRDKAGVRNGYYYGEDCYITNPYEYREMTTNTDARVGMTYYANSAGNLISYGSILYGINVYDISPTGLIRFQGRYNDTYTKTIDGTYTVEVYLLKWPNDQSPFTTV